MTVHIVEDDRAVADSLALVLAQMGHAVEIYNDGRTFLQAELSSDDKIILDLHLPDMAAATILSHAKDRGTGVIVITALGKSQIDREIPGFDPDRILRKPIDPQMLARLL